MPEKTSEPAKRHEPLPRIRDPWNTGYRCLLCEYSTDYWPDDGSAEQDIFTHLSDRHPKSG